MVERGSVDRSDDTDKYWGDPRYADMGQAERAWTAQRDGWRLSYLDSLHAAEHEAGLVRGHHLLAWSDMVTQLKRERRYEEVLTVLLEIIGATEAEQAVEQRNAPLRAEHVGLPEQSGDAARLDQARCDRLPRARRP